MKHIYEICMCIYIAYKEVAHCRELRSSLWLTHLPPLAEVGGSSHKPSFLIST